MKKKRVLVFFLIINVFLIILGYFLWTILFPIQEIESLSRVQLFELQKEVTINYELGKILMYVGGAGTIVSLICLIRKNKGGVSVKSNWKKYGIIVIILIISFFLIRNKYFYTRLFSEEFCDSIIEIQYVTYENEVYRITDEKVVRDFADALCNNKYKKIPVLEGSYTFIFVTEDAEYDVGMSASHITWEGKYYEPKVEFFEIFAEVWDYLGMD